MYKKQLLLGCLLLVTATAAFGQNNGNDAPRSKQQVFSYVEKMPEFPGNLSKYISENINYPEFAREHNIYGKVVVKFVVDEVGKISDISILHSPDTSLSRAATELMKKMPNWRPGSQNGELVKVYFTLPFSFALLKEDIKN